MSTVQVPVASVERSVSPDMFADIAPAVEVEFTTAGDQFVVSFAGELAAEQLTAVRDRLLSVDAAQEAARGEIRGLLGSDASALAVALARYVLGD